MSNRRKIYISLPITGLEVNAVKEKADLIKARFSRLGWNPVSPFDVYAGRNPEYADYICTDLRAMMDCDAVYFCKGWEMSCGCSIEHDTALRLKAFRRKEYELIYE